MSIRSMTGFARKKCLLHKTPYFFEIQSVNKKHLEIHFSPGKMLGSAEMEIRNVLQKAAHRGHVLFRWYRDPGHEQSAHPTMDALKTVDKQLEDMALELGYTKDWNLPFLLEYYRNASVLSKEVLDTMDVSWDTVLPPLITQWNATRTKEGKCLAEDLEQCLERIQETIGKLSPYIEKQRDEAQRKLEDRIAEVHQLQEEDRLRVHKEVALYADKWDISEEVLRLSVHIKSFKEILREKELAHGRRLEFLVQEMLREANTMASKSVNIQAIGEILSIKSECDRIKEQVQNIE